METKILKSINLIRRGSGVNLNFFRYTAMVLVLLTLGIGNAWAGGGTKYYYAKLKINQAGATGAGSVYVAKDNSKPSPNPGTAVTSNSNTSSGGNVTMYYWIDVNAGYTVTLTGDITAGPATGATLNGTPSLKTATSDGEGNAKSYTATATFVAVTVNSVDAASKDLAPTNPSIDYPFTVTFATSNLKTIALDLNKSPETADGKFTITSWVQDGNNVIATGKFNGGGSYGGAGRNHSTTVSLQSKASGSAAKTCTVTANFPALAFVGVEATDVYATQGESGKTGSATFTYNYGAEDDFPTAPTLTPVSGTGALAITGYTVTPNFSDGTCEVTVDYTYDTNNGVGDTEATLTLTAANGDARSVTIAGHSEAAATNDVSVTTAAGVTTEYATWAAGLAAANASAGSTLKLLRDIDLTGTYGITGTQGITQTMTLDLNGKTLSASTGGSILNPSKSGKTLTIKDSKTGGKIQNIADLNGTLYAINVGAGVTLNVESGYIYVENQSQYAYGTSTYTDGTPNISSMQARGIHMAATSIVNISGGKIHAVASCNAFGIREESSKANNTVLTITGGEIIGEAPRYAYGIYAGGKVNISGGTVTALLNDKTVNGNTTYTANAWNDYTLHRYGYGIQMFASSNATAANCYFGTLTITGGTINAINVNKTLNSSSAVQSEHTYGIMMYYSMTGAGAGKTAPDGSKVMKASAIGSIENATINVTHAGSTAYGIMAYGSHNSFDNTTTPLQIKNTTINVEAFASAYGVYANVYVNWSSSLANHTGNGGCTAGEFELTNTTINATTTGGAGAYCAWASATSGTVADAKATTGSQSTGNATYCGEYAAAGKITVNSGTYTANAATSSAYGIGSSDRAKTVRSIKGALIGRDAAVDPLGSLGGAAEAYPELNIHGGNFSATTGTTTAVAVKSGGNTLIDGGTFNAYAGGSTAYGLYVTAGKTTANGVTFPASATTVAYGVYVYGGISDWSLFPYYGEVELNNCNATAIARTTTDARAVYVNGTTKVYTQASFDAMKTANNSNYQNYGDYAQVGERAFVGKATINGGTYSATAETTTAFGIYMMSTRVSTNKEAIAYNPLVVKNATIAAKTNTSTSAYGVSIGGGGLIENCTITATAGTTTASGVRAIDKTTVIKNSTISAKGTDAVYGLEGYVDASTAHGYCWHGDFDLSEAGTTKVTAESTGATKAYTIFLNAKAVNVASGTFAGDYATAANATINGGTYIAKTNGGTNGYALSLTATQTKGSASAQPEVLVTDGKFNGATAEVGTAGVVGHVQLKGGYYLHNTNLSKYIPEGYEEFPLPDDRPEYAEGYRYAIEPVGNHGNYVCQIGNNKYKTLEEALQVVTSGQVIYMIANYTMVTPGDYVLPSGATLLIPYKEGTGKGATTAIGNSAETTTSGTTPTLFRKLTFGNGVNLICSGTIETSAQQKANGQYGANVGMPSGAYGQIHMEEGSHISMESGSRLNCWGYITGKGTINVKKNATVLEGFQMGDWCGGTNASNLIGNDEDVFPVTHYFYQSIECPITYRPGSRALGSTHIAVSVPFLGTQVYGQDNIALVGTSGSMFIMDDNDVSAETWVMKDYDEATDQCIWTVNSGASLGNLTISVSSYNMESADYDLPITTNMSVVLNYGEMEIGQNSVFLPGSKLIINKQGTAVLNGVTVTAYDAADWTSTKRYFATYSPTWGTTNPRSSIAVKSAEVFLHGKLDIRSNGGLYTTPGGANIHSTNADAGEVIYTTAAQGNTTNYYLQQGGTTRTAVTTSPAKLKNTDGSYASSAGTTSGKTWTFKNDIWDAWSKDGCFFMNAQDEPHAKPAALVQLTSKTPDSNHLHHDAATGTRNFVWDENCYWWEVVTTPTAEGYYKSLNADNNGDYNYYYYDNAAACWKIKKITITWNINGTTTNYSVGYGTKPEWLGATPTKTSSSSDYVWRWDGWTKGSDATVIANNDLPFVTENTTFTAHFYEKYYEYNITFKNDDGSILESKNWNKGSMPSYEGTPTKNPTAAETYEFNGTWSPAITTVTGSATYTAQYTATPRAYTITFLNYDMSKLGTAEVVYNNTPSNATYLAAVAPKTEDPYKPDNSAFSFEFAGWRLQGASSNGFAQVKGDQTYIAQFAETTKKYRIEFVDEDGETVLHYLQLEYGQTPSYTWDNPSKQDAEWTYVFTGWTPATFSQVKGPQTYVANYDKTKREYTITWKDGDGNTLKTDQVAYGSTPSYSGATPTKASTNDHSYVFNNTWSPAIVAVTGEATYTAQFNETERKYRVTWDAAANGGACATEYTDFSYNAAIGTLPVATKEGHTFNGWFTSATGGTQITTATKVTADVTYHAQFTINKYSFSIGVTPAGYGSVDVASITQIPHGTTVTSSGNTFTVNGTTVTATPTTADAQCTYKFDHWNNVPATATDNVTNIEAVFTRSTNTYTVTWKNGDVTLETDENVAYGATPHYDGATPTKTATAEWTYEFAGWDNEVVAVTGDVTYNATFNQTKNSYEITWLNDDNSLIDKTTVEYGVVPTHADATKANTAEYTYTFTGWDNTPVAVTGAATYKATFSSSKNSYEITWLNDDNSLIDKTTVEYGVVPTHADATKANTAEYTYTFTGWDNTPVAVTGVATYKATFSSSKNSYEITWLNDDNSLIDKTTVEYGVVPTHADATKANTAEYTYTFTGWDNTPVAVTGAATYKATFSSSKNSYEITWLNDDNSLIDKTTVEYGVVPTHADATKANTAEYTYTFTGWDNTPVAVTGVATYKATFSSSKNQYTLTLLSNNDEWGTVTGGGLYDYNTAHTITATPKSGFKFVKWNDDNTNASREVIVTADVTFTATFDYDIANYTVKHWQQNIDDDYYTEVASETKSGTIGAQTNAEAKTYTGFIAQPFDQQTIVVEGTTVVNLYYNRETHTISWIVKLNGETVDSKEETLRYGATPSFGPDPTKEQDDQYEYSFSGWTPTIAEVTTNQTYEGSFNAIARTYDVTWNNTDGTLIAKEVSKYTWGAQPSFKGNTPEYSDGTSKVYEFRGWKYERTGAEYAKDATLPGVAGEEETYTALYTCMEGPIDVANGKTETISTNTETVSTTVHEGGMLKVQAGQTLTTATLILEASENASGQIVDEGTITTANAYFHLSHKGGFKARTWYAVAVPWKVLLPGEACGVYIKNGETIEKQYLGTTFDLIYYDGASRAQGKTKAWRYVEDDEEAQQFMDPGRAYMIYLTSDADTIRFARNNGSSLHKNSLYVYTYESSINTTYADWNGIANPATYHAYLNVGATDNIGQIYETETKRYKQFNMRDSMLVVGQPIFVQPAKAGTVMANSSSYNSSASAPRRAKEQVSLTRYELMLAASDADVSDRVIVRMDEEKTENEYVIGQDLVKMGVSDIVPQMWINRYDSKMCVNTIAGFDDTADYPLGIFAPKDGEYDLFIEDQPDNESMLYLTYDGAAIWNLSFGGYVANLNKGTNTHYGLRIVRKAPQITTGIEETTIQNGETIRKVLVNDKVYIIRNGEIYSVTGQKAK